MLSEEERVVLTDEQLAQLSRDDLIKSYKQLQKYIDSLTAKHHQTDRAKSIEMAKMKNIILMRHLATKEQELSNQEKLKNNHHQQSAPQQRICLVDPSINAIIVQLKKELEETRKKKDELQNELNSWKFNPESQISKRLMAKCRKLLQENEELGKIISSGNIAQLENDLAYHKELLNEACENEQNINSFLADMDNEMDAMQATIVELQQRLKSKEATSNNLTQTTTSQVDELANSNESMKS